MKTVVSLQELVDTEIRPDRLFDEFRELTRTAVGVLASGPLTPVACQACGAAAAQPAFEKLGLSYRECERCGTVYVSPRPSAEALARYHATSPASIFWRDRVLKETMATRRDKLAIPRAEWVAEGLAEHRAHARSGVDVSPPGTMLIEALAEIAPDVRVAPMPATAGALPHHGRADFVTAFDTIDRLADVPGFIAQVREALGPGGILFLTAPTISGFDLQVLWDRSPAVLPPDKLNLLSIDGFASLFAAPAWEIIELSTPGMFDVENVRHAIAQDPDARWPRAIRRLVAGGERSRLELQEYLQAHRLASFARLVVRRN